MTDTAPVPGTDQEPDLEPRRLRLWVCPLIGLGAAFIGLLPWLISGARLPTQDLWASQTGAMPIALLPLTHSQLTFIFGLIVIGAAAAGIAARALDARLPRGGFSLITVGLLVAQAVAIAQSALVLRDGLEARTESTIYLAALIAVCVVSFLVGIVTLLLVARAPRAGALLGLTIGAIAAGPWVSGLLRPLLETGSEGVATALGLVQWVTPVLTGVAIAWTGVGTVGRVLAALVSLALLWAAPAVITGIASATGSRVLARDPLEMIDYGISVTRAALLIPELALRPIIAAVIVAVIGLIARWGFRRARRKPRTAEVPSDAVG